MWRRAASTKGGTITPGQPIALFTAKMAITAGRLPADVPHDGRFLVNVELNDAPTPPITPLQNWKPQERPDLAKDDFFAG